MCVPTPDQVREKLSDIKKDFFFREEKNNKQQQQQQKTTTTRKKQTNKTKNGGTGAVQDEPFDELLMFIVGKDSALFSGL